MCAGDVWGAVTLIAIAFIGIACITCTAALTHRVHQDFVSRRENLVQELALPLAQPEHNCGQGPCGISLLVANRTAEHALQ